MDNKQKSLIILERSLFRVYSFKSCNVIEEEQQNWSISINQSINIYFDKGPKWALHV